MIKKIVVAIAVFLSLALAGDAQPFAAEIAAFKKADSIAAPFPGQHPIVFAGSSSFRMWKSLEADFPGLPLINRGFGGSTLPDVIRYADETILTYMPRQVVIYCGENDLALADSITAKMVLQRFKKLFFKIRRALPQADIAFVSIKPSPSRARIQPRVVEANRRIKKFLKNRKETAYIDVYYPMLNGDGTMKIELFIADDLHMNEKGYAIWQKIIEPYLLR